MRGVVLRVLASSMEGPFPEDDQVFLVEWDVNAMDGFGFARLGDRPDAHVFASAIDAMAAWREQSTVRPIRWDGQPNRPLTAYTVMVLEVD